MIVVLVVIQLYESACLSCGFARKGRLFGGSFLDLGVEQQGVVRSRFGLGGGLTSHEFGPSIRCAPPLPAWAARPPLDLSFGSAVGPLFLFDQCLPIGDGDLIVVGMNFAEGQEPVAVATVLDERGLQ